MTKPTECPGNNLLCPNPDCGKPLGLPLFHARNGDGFLVCDHKVGAFQTRRNCNQYIYWHCTNHLCTVVAITRDDYERLKGLETGEIFRELGLKVAGGQAA